MGHDVVRLQETTVSTSEVLQQALKSDGLIWVHSHGFVNQGRPMSEVLEILKQNNIPTIAYHLDLYMGLERWSEYENSDYMKVQHFFTVDKLMADWFNENTQTKGHYLQAGVFEQECVIETPHPKTDNKIIFVGSKGYHPEWQYRPQLIDWLRSNYNDFVHVSGDGDTGTIRGLELNRVYANSIAIGDSLCLNFDYPYYWSDRVYESLGRGGFIIHPYIKGMEQHFEDKKHLVFYEFNNFEQLRYLIEYYKYNVDEREAIRKAGHEHVKANHTYTTRWQTILDTVYEI